MWYEVECKVKIRDYLSLKKKVKALGIFKYKTLKRDEYFSLKKKGYPKKAFRVRDDDGSFIVNFKKHVRSLSNPDVVVKEEFEFSIKDKNELSNFMSLCEDLGFREWVSKTKESEVYSYTKDKHLSIELNKVRGLGYWMEVEYLCSRKDIPKAKSLIKSVLKELEIMKVDINNEGYTKMLYEHKKRKING